VLSCRAADGSDGDATISTALDGPETAGAWGGTAAAGEGKGAGGADPATSDGAGVGVAAAPGFTAR